MSDGPINLESSFGGGTLEPKPKPIDAIVLEREGPFRLWHARDQDGDLIVEPFTDLTLAMLWVANQSGVHVTVREGRG